MKATYLDSSALVKLVIVEEESGALLRYLRRRESRVACALVRVEVGLAARHAGRRARDRANRLLHSLDLVRLDDALLDSAAGLGASIVRSLDAIHLAAALTLGDDLDELVTYDRRMSAAARSLGIEVAAPA